jgi:hypothetical protein
MEKRGLACKKFVLSLLVAVAACHDSPTQPVQTAVRGGPATLEVERGADQSAPVGSPVAVEPAVVVRDASGAPLPGVSVLFRVTAGGGSIGTASASTDALGVARAGSWQLGGVPGANVLEATVGQLMVRFTAIAESAFDIEVRYVGTATTRQKDAVQRAIARWRSIIISELSDVPLRVPAHACFEDQPAVDEVIDDLLLFVSFDPIDGANGVLGQAGPCYVRNDGRLPLVGSLTLDAADLLQAELSSTLDDIVLHEIGHVLGFGTIWQEKGLLLGARGSDPQFTGVQALAAYRVLDGTRISVPVENSGSSGTRDGHWRDSVFGQELMTGYISGAMNPLSSITIGSLADLGYATYPGAADVYSLVRPSTVPSPVPGVGDLADRETLLYPRYRTDRNGSPTLIPR